MNVICNLDRPAGNSDVNVKVTVSASSSKVVVWGANALPSNVATIHSCTETSVEVSVRSVVGFEMLISIISSPVKVKLSRFGISVMSYSSGFTFCGSMLGVVISDS